MIVVAGEALVDLIPGPGNVLQAVPGGGPFNVARTVGRLGHPCRFLGRFSQDRFGGVLLAALAEDRVSVAIPDRLAEPTALAVAELDVDGAATYRFYLEHTASVSLRPPDLPLGLLDQVDALHVGSLGLVAEPIASTLEGLVRACPPAVIVMVDLNCRPAAITDEPTYRARLVAVLTRANVVKASVEDLAFLCPELPAVTAAASLLGETTALVLLTDGERPVRLVDRAGVTVVAVPDVAVVDTVGAGDAFGGAFLAGWVEARSLGDPLTGPAVERVASAAVQIAADTCTRTGADPPRRTSP